MRAARRSLAIGRERFAAGGGVVAGCAGATLWHKASACEDSQKESRGFDGMKKWFEDAKAGAKLVNNLVAEKQDALRNKVIRPRGHAEVEEQTREMEKKETRGAVLGWKTSLSSMSEDLLAQMESLSGLTTIANQIRKVVGGDSKDSASAVETLISSARETKNAGEFQKNQSFSDLLALFQEYSSNVQATLEKNFGHIDLANLDPTSLFYYLEHEDEKKNPSWKRRKHRFMYGADVHEVDALHDSLFLADLSYLDSVEEVKAGLKKSKHGSAWELLFCVLDGYPGQPAHYVAVKKGGRSTDPITVLLVVRGTKTIGDVFTDALMDAVEYEGGMAHGGIVDSGRWLTDKHMDFLKSIKSSTGKEVNIQIVGHSLGAGAATICGMELKKNGFRSVDVVGFGCPALLSLDLSGKCKDYVTSVIADSDVIPRCSNATLANLLLDILEFDFTDRAMRDVTDALLELRKMSPISISDDDLQIAQSVVSKGMDKYVKPRIKDQTSQRATPLLFPPGECLHVYRDGMGVSCCYVPCDFFNEIDVSRTMISDHLISGYDWIFLDLMRDYYKDPYYK